MSSWFRRFNSSINAVLGAKVPDDTVPIVISIVVVLICLLQIALTKSLQVDEVESITAASMIFDGQTPYKDFWQIHTPLFYYFLVPLCLFFKTMKIIYVTRLIAFFLLLVNGFFVYTFIKTFFSPKAALLGALSYFVCLPVLNIETRPDVLVALFSDLSLLLLVYCRLPAQRAFFLSGISAAMALLSKQSGSFCIFSIVLFFAIRSLVRRDECWDRTVFTKERFNVRNYRLFMAGLLLPCAGFYLLLVHQGAVNAFLQCAVKNDFLNSFLFLKVQSVHHFPFQPLGAMFLANPLIFLSMLALFFYMALYRKKVDTKKLNAFVLVFAFFAVSFGSLFMILHAWKYEFLLDSQYLVFLAVPLLVFVYEEVFNFFAQRNRISTGVALNTVMLLCLCLPPFYYTYKSAKFDLPGSVATHDQIISLTNKHDKCFSVMPVPFRPNVYFYHIGLVLVESPRTSAMVENKLIDEILHDNVVVIVPDRRYMKMKHLVSLIRDNYIGREYPFYVPGKVFSAETPEKNSFNVLIAGYYRIKANGKNIFLDGKPVMNRTIYLNTGGHSVYFSNNQNMCLINQRICRIFYDLKANKRKTR